MKPTCCIPLRLGMKFIAVLDFLISVMGVVSSIGGFIYFELESVQLLKWLGDPPPELQTFINLKILGGTMVRVLLGMSVTYWLQKFFLGIILLMAVFQKKRSLLRIWIMYTLILLVISVFGFLGIISYEIAEPYSIPFYVLAFLGREYTIWGVYAYLKRLQLGKDEFHSTFPSEKVISKL